MRLETFRGPDLSTACADARAALGDDALIVETRANREGARSWIEIVAAPSGDVGRFARTFAPQRALTRPTVRGPNGSARPRVLALVGPTGAGKTTTIAKLAVHPSAFGEWNVGLLTLDTHRAGAVEQLQGYASAADLQCEVAYDARELSAAMRRLSRCELVLVDTPGRGPRTPTSRPVWRDLLTTMRADETHLVVSAATRTELAGHVRAEYQQLGVTHSLLTKLDEVPHDSNIAALASGLRLPARWTTDGQDVPTDLHGAGPAVLGRLGFARASLALA